MENSNPKLKNLQDYLSLQAQISPLGKTTPNTAPTIPLLLTDAAIVQSMMEQITSTNQVLTKLMKRPTDFWLKSDEVLEFLGVSDTTFRNWRNRGLIGYSQYERLIMVHWSDLEKFLNANKKEAFQYKSK